MLLLRRSLWVVDHPHRSRWVHVCLIACVRILDGTGSFLAHRDVAPAVVDAAVVLRRVFVLVRSVVRCDGLRVLSHIDSSVALHHHLLLIKPTLCDDACSSTSISVGVYDL